jgi:hypothetical protein
VQSSIIEVGMQSMKKKKNVSFEAEDGLIARLRKSAKAAGRTLSGHIRFVLEMSEAKSEVAK